MIRSRKILDAARGEDCLVGTPACNHDPETVVAAHANWQEYGKGMGQKAHDIFVAFACSGCHAYIDANQQDARLYWQRGHIRTLVRLWEKGVIGDA